MNSQHDRSVNAGSFWDVKIFMISSKNGFSTVEEDFPLLPSMNMKSIIPSFALLPYSVHLFEGHDPKEIVGFA